MSEIQNKLDDFLLDLQPGEIYFSKKDQHGKKLLVKYFGELEPKQSIVEEIYAGRVGAFKPRMIKMLGLKNDFEKVNFEILGTYIMGMPQNINYGGHFIPEHVESSLTYEDFRPIDWMVFGSSCGQGLMFNLRNPHDFPIKIYMMVYGDPAENQIIGRF
jgi:hypothetical protein